MKSDTVTILSNSVIFENYLAQTTQIWKRAVRQISVNFSNVPTQAVWSSLGTSSLIAHMAHLSSKSCIDPAGHLQSSGFFEVGTLSPGQMPKYFMKCK